MITSTAGAKRKMSTTRSRSAVTPSASEGGGAEWFGYYYGN